MCRARCKGLHQTLFRCFSSQQTYKKESTFGRETAEKSGAVEIQWGDSRIFQQFRKGKKDGPRKLPCLFRWRRQPPVAFCRESAKRPADGNKSPMTFLSKRQDSPCENRANGRGTGTERKCANLTRPRECKMKAESRFLRHFAVSHGTPCGRNPLPASAPQGEWLAKGQTRFARGRTPSRAGKAFRSPAFPVFLHPLGLPCGKKFRLCGRRFISLRKAIPFLPRKNDRRAGEMLHTDSSSTRFLTVRPLLADGRIFIETRKRKESLSF